MEEIKNINTDELLEENIPFEEMEFDPEKATIFYKDKQGNTKKIIVYNPNESQEKELMNIIMKYGNPQENGQLNLDMPESVVMAEVLPLLTSYDFSKVTKEQINNIISNPSTVLKKVMAEVFEVIIDTLKTNYKISKKTKEVVEEIGGIDENKLIEMSKRQEQIKTLEVELEQEKQKTLQEKAKTNDELVKELLDKVNKLETEKIELETKLETKPKRKYTKKNKAKDDVVEFKEGETING